MGENGEKRRIDWAGENGTEHQALGAPRESILSRRILGAVLPSVPVYKLVCGSTLIPIPVLTHSRTTKAYRQGKPHLD